MRFSVLADIHERIRLGSPKRATTAAFERQGGSTLLLRVLLP
jgi:hypothetical protein